MLFCVLNDPRFPCPRTHLSHVRKLGEGFVQRGYHYRELRRAAEIANLSACDLLYVSNHFSVDFLHRRFACILAKRLFSELRKTSARLILWNFHTLADWDCLRRIEDRTMHLGEDLWPESVAAEARLRGFREEFGVLALQYASPLHPQHATFHDLPRCWDFNFVGNGYKRELTRHCADRYRSLIRNTPPAISEPLRVNSFRLAEVNLVFHSDANIRKGVVVERFAEALSLGGILFHDHPRIAPEYAGVESVIQVNTVDDIDREFQRVMALSAQDRRHLREKSFHAWLRSGLSYFDQAGRILAAFDGLGNSSEARCAEVHLR